MGKKKRKKTSKPIAGTVDRHMLYEEAVQATDYDLDFFERVFRRYRKRPLRSLREDFCGTAYMACEWVKRNKQNKAWGIDLDEPTLAWGRKHHMAYLDEEARKRLHPIHGNVLTARAPATDATVAFNFSYWIFKTRPELLTYFKKVRADMKRDGILFLDAFGGQHSMGHMKDRRKIGKSKRADGLKLPKYTYIWDQARFNTINHDILCHIHFRFSDGSRIDKAFTYNWRLWTLPEIQELLIEAGFKDAHVYLHGWDKDGESDETYRRRTFYKNELAWVGYIVGVK
jgi:hypothetical protein